MIMRTLLLFCLVLYGAATAAESRLQAVEEAEGAGALTRSESVAYRLLSLRNSPLLPASFRGLPQPVSRLGTGLAVEARLLLETAHGSERLLLQQALDRPTHLPYYLISPSGRFRIHYHREGEEAATEEFVVAAAEACDHAYSLIVEEMGYPPPPDDPVDGPEYDVYLYNIIDYGFTTPETTVPRPGYPLGCTSFIQMDNDFVSTYS